MHLRIIAKLERAPVACLGAGVIAPSLEQERQVCMRSRGVGCYVGGLAKAGLREVSPARLKVTISLVKQCIGAERARPRSCGCGCGSRRGGGACGNGDGWHRWTLRPFARDAGSGRASSDHASGRSNASFRKDDRMSINFPHAARYSGVRECAIAGASVSAGGAMADLQQRQRGRRVVGEAEQRQVLAVDHAVPDERLEVDDLVPVRRAVEQDRNAPLDLLGLHQRQDLHQLVERAEAAGKHDQRAREMREPQLAHEEVVELERQARRDVGVGPLLVRQADVEADRLAAGVGGAAVGGLHDAAAAARADDAVADVRRRAASTTA